MGAEVVAFAHPVDVAMLLKHDFKAILRTYLTLWVLTYSCSLFSVVARSTMMREVLLIFALCTPIKALEYYGTRGIVLCTH